MLVRFVFQLAALVLTGILLIVMTLLGLDDLPEPVWIVAPLVVFVGAWGAQSLIYRRWLDRHRPAYDITRLKVYLEADGARVLETRPDGVFTGGRSGPDWRNYVAKVRLADGSEATRKIGVEVTLFNRPSIRDHDNPRRPYARLD